MCTLKVIEVLRHTYFSKHPCQSSYFLLMKFECCRVLVFTITLYKAVKIPESPALSHSILYRVCFGVSS